MKTLITKQNIDSRISPVDHRFHADGDIIITAGARDELRSRGIRIVYSPMPSEAPAAAAPAASCRSADKLERAVASISTLLRSRFGIEDPETIRGIIENAIRAVRNS